MHVKGEGILGNFEERISQWRPTHPGFARNQMTIIYMAELCTKWVKCIYYIKILLIWGKIQRNLWNKYDGWQNISIILWKN